MDFKNPTYGVVAVEAMMTQESSGKIKRICLYVFSIKVRGFFAIEQIHPNKKCLWMYLRGYGFILTCVTEKRDMIPWCCRYLFVDTAEKCSSTEKQIFQLMPFWIDDKTHWFKKSLDPWAVGYFSRPGMPTHLIHNWMIFLTILHLTFLVAFGMKLVFLKECQNWNHLRPFHRAFTHIEKNLWDVWEVCISKAKGRNRCRRVVTSPNLDDTLT